jgi:CarD family transcriptional regulator
MFKQGDHVVHPRHGAGTMLDPRIIKRDGEERCYHCIELVDDRGIVMIPEEHIEDAGLRRAVVDATLIQAIMHKSPGELPDHHRERHAHLQTQIASGDPGQIIQSLRDLCWREHRCTLNTSDTRLKTRALLLLTYELAAKSALDVEAAQRRIRAIIRTAIQTHVQATESAT